MVKVPAIQMMIAGAFVGPTVIATRVTAMTTAAVPADALIHRPVGAACQSHPALRMRETVTQMLNASVILSAEMTTVI